MENSHNSVNERTNEDLVQDIRSYGFIACESGNKIIIGNSYTKTELDSNIIRDINAYHNMDQGNVMMNIVFTTLGLSINQYIVHEVKTYPKKQTRMIVELFKVEPVYHG